MISNRVAFLFGAFVLKGQTETHINNTFNIIGVPERAAPALTSTACVADLRVCCKESLNDSPVVILAQTLRTESRHSRA
jgi:hypothetical protein